MTQKNSSEPEKSEPGKVAQHQAADQAKRHESNESMSFLQTTQSVLWAMLGVQSKRNARRDFSKGKLSHFVIIGIGFTLIFILTLVSVIRMVIPE